MPDAMCGGRTKQDSVGTLYIRRRSQLLRENAKRNRDETVRVEYLQIRRQLLQMKFEHNLLSEAGSERGRSLSRISNISGTRAYVSYVGGLKDSSSHRTAVIPTKEASASRALVGDTSISENYAFAGVHHIFDQVGNNKGTVRTTNVSTGIIPSQLICNLGHSVLSIAFHPNGGLLWAADDMGGITAFIFNPMTGQLARKRRTIVRSGFPVTGLQCRTWLSREACDPTLLVNCGCDQLFVYRVCSNEGTLMLRCSFPLAHRTFAVKSTFSPLMSFRRGVPLGTYPPLVFSKDSFVLTGSEDGSVYFFDVEDSGKHPFNSLQGHSMPVVGVSFSYDEAYLASADAGGSVIIWTRTKRDSEGDM
ncbi:unnamed protein product [Notodromas monacha]|uniref:WD repeat domain 13 n=1 Tax=Notodromas monacha TaxID=399045 RepID=A0A7R9BJ79_9CRUS|nr:unnamed protein product [Notodromas monacha]CAG0915140.1 unnamed protein product [Notodromas monacha]